MCCLVYIELPREMTTVWQSEAINWSTDPNIRSYEVVLFNNEKAAIRHVIRAVASEINDSIFTVQWSDEDMKLMYLDEENLLVFNKTTTVEQVNALIETHDLFAGADGSRTFEFNVRHVDVWYKDEEEDSESSDDDDDDEDDDDNNEVSDESSDDEEVDEDIEKVINAVMNSVTPASKKRRVDATTQE